MRMSEKWEEEMLARENEGNFSMSKVRFERNPGPNAKGQRHYDKMRKVQKQIRLQYAIRQLIFDGFN